MKLAYVASEIMPFASTGGLADVAGALPAALAKKGHAVWRVMPMYRQVREGPFKLRDIGLKLSIPVGFRSYTAEVWQCEDVTPLTYFIRRDEYFDRSQLYSLPDRDYEDNFERFIFFQKAVVALIDALDMKPDIVHGNDWQTGLLPLFLEHGIQGTGRGRKEKTVFTIHNLAYQGIFSGDNYSSTNLPFFCFSVDTMEFYGNISFMKCGITTSDIITTVSKTYAEEIQTEESGCGLHGVLATVKDRLVGIINGIDNEAWNPATDPHIATPFSAADLSGKKACKRDLIQRMGLKISDDTPLIGMVTRLVEQKGFDILALAMDELMKLDVGVALLGTGREQYEELCKEWAETWPGKFAFVLDYDPELSHKIEAGSDLFLMPSQFEPCGLNQLYSLRYGTIPVVHAVGGLKDTIEDVGPDGQIGYGVQFKAYTPMAMLEAIHRAIELYRKRETWDSVVNRAMAQEFSWARSADEYVAIYERILAAK
jgi:starch synthase